MATDFGTFFWPASGGSGSGVTSLNSLVGDITLAAGTGISITPSGQTLTIASTSAGDVTLGAFGSTPNANGLSISVSQVLNMEPADGTHPGGVSILAQTFAGAKTFTGVILASDGTNSAPGISFSGDTNTGIYRLGADDLAIAAGSFAGLEIKKSTGSFANVGMGSAPSASDNYPLLLQRSNVSTGTYAQISNPDTSASSKATWQLATDLGANTGELSVFTAATATAAYAGSLVLRPSDSTLRLSLIGGDLSTGYVTTYTGGDYTSTGETTRFNADHTNQFMQSVTAPTSPAAGLKFYNNAGVFSSKTTGGVVSSFAGVNTGDQTITLTGDITGSGTGSIATTLATVNSNVGSFGSSTAIPSFTVNGKGLVTAASTNVVIAPAGTLTGTTLASNVVTSSLTAIGTIATGVWQGTKIGLAYGGTNADLSATGGTSNVLKQSSSGAAITVGQLAFSDISSTVSSSQVTTATFTAPTVQIFTSGSAATYTTPTSPRGPLYITVEIWGGGGGGGGSGTGAGTAAGDGGSSLWKDGAGSSTLISAGGGTKGTQTTGGSGGTNTVSGPTTILNVQGTAGGGNAFYSAATGTAVSGGAGGMAPVLNGGGVLARNSEAGAAGVANTGGGGQGGGTGNTLNVASGSGGGSGGYVKATIASPASTYQYTVGASGSAGGAGTSGLAGGAGAAGRVVVTEYYQ